MEKVYLKGTSKVNVGEYSLVHCIHNSYQLDGGELLKDPRNLFADELSINILLGLVPDHVCRNLTTVVENAHLDVSGKVFDLVIHNSANRTGFVYKIVLLHRKNLLRYGC